ncbi:MAG TPA: hypothetical protein VIT67_07650 [Povalibacter sp.]
MRASTSLAAVLFAGVAPLVSAQESGPSFTDEFPIEECDFVPRGGNAYFNLTPGRQLYLTNQQCVATGECDELEELWITVLSDTRDIVLRDDGKKRRITTRVVEEMEMADGELVEISRNYFATCRRSRDVYYFGEDVDIYKDGKIVSHDGAWLAGRHRAEPGIIMVDSGFVVGSRYYQEKAPAVALDRAEHVAFDLEISTPAGAFEDCIQVTETSPLEPGHESIKFYCPRVGLVADGDLTLQAVYVPRKDKRP